MRSGTFLSRIKFCIILYINIVYIGLCVCVYLQSRFPGKQCYRAFPEKSNRPDVVLYLEDALVSSKQETVGGIFRCRGCEEPDLQRPKRHSHTLNTQISVSFHDSPRIRGPNIHLYMRRLVKHKSPPHVDQTLKHGDQYMGLNTLRQTSIRQNTAAKMTRIS